VRALLAHRIGRAGGGSDLSMTFANDALDLIVDSSLGTPRRLLTLAHATLEEAALRGHPRALRVDAEAAVRSRGFSLNPPPAEERIPENGAVNGAVEEPQKSRRWPWLAALRFP